MPRKRWKAQILGRRGSGYVIEYQSDTSLTCRNDSRKGAVCKGGRMNRCTPHGMRYEDGPGKSSLWELDPGFCGGHLNSSGPGNTVLCSFPDSSRDWSLASLLHCGVSFQAPLRADRLAKSLIQCIDRSRESARRKIRSRPRRVLHWQTSPRDRCLMWHSSRSPVLRNRWPGLMNCGHASLQRCSFSWMIDRLQIRIYGKSQFPGTCVNLAGGQIT